MSRRSLPLGRPVAAVRRRVGLPAGGTGSGVTARCPSNAPGHQMHYIHQGQALRSPSEHAQHVILDGTRVVILRGSGDQLDWRHHDPGRLADVLGLFPTSRIVYPDHHALRVGPYWFNCAKHGFSPCDLPEDRP